MDIAIDVAAERPPVVSTAGPTFEPEELAGRKLGALFSRAEARDFADVYVLAQRFGRTVLLERAAALDRFTDDEVPIATSDVDTVRAFFREWANDLEKSHN